MVCSCVRLQWPVLQFAHIDMIKNVDAKIYLYMYICMYIFAEYHVYV